MALPKGPITIQVSPSTYSLMLKLADLCVEYYGVANDIRFKASVQVVLDTLYTDLIAANPGTPTTIADLYRLQTDGLTEASAINKRVGAEIVMAC